MKRIDEGETYGFRINWRGTVVAARYKCLSELHTQHKLVGHPIFGITLAKTLRECFKAVEQSFDVVGLEGGIFMLTKFDLQQRQPHQGISRQNTYHSTGDVAGHGKVNVAAESTTFDGFKGGESCASVFDEIGEGLRHLHVRNERGDERDKASGIPGREVGEW